MGLGLRVFPFILRVTFLFTEHTSVEHLLHARGWDCKKETEPLPCVGFAEKLCDMPAGALVLPGEEGAFQIGGKMRGHWGAGVLRRVPQVSTEAGASPRTEVSDDHLDSIIYLSICLPT